MTSLPLESLHLDAPGKAPAPVRARRAASMFWPALWLGVALTAAKIACLEDASIWMSVKQWLVVAAQDAFFALSYGLVGQLILLALRRRPRIQRMAFVSLTGLALLCVLYALLSANVYGYFRTLPTWTLLAAGADLRGMRSSLHRFVTPAILATVLAVPLAWIGIVLLSHRAAPRPGRLTRILLIMVLIGWYGVARVSISGQPGSDLARAAQNPHLLLATSFINEKFLHPNQDLGIEFATDYSSDFQTVAQRGGSITPNLRRGPKNVIVVVCESVSTQFLSLYGSSYQTWPRMERHAADAMVFENYHANVTNTANSLFTFTLSCYPPLTGDEHTAKRPDAAGTSAAQILASRGYRTAFVSAGYNDWARQDEFLATRGYDTIWDGRDSGLPELNSWGMEDKAAIDLTFRYIDQDPRRTSPFYIFAWTQANHHPYGADFGMPNAQWENPDFLKGETKWGNWSWDLARYLSALYELDKQLDRLFEGLKARGLAEDTIVIITGDHGEVFGWPHKAYGHGGGVYQEYTNVPFIIWNPTLFKNAPRNKQIGGHTDLQPTVLDLLGIAPAQSWQGRSLFSADHPPRTYFFGSADQGYLGVRENDFKYIYNRVTKSEQLFNLAIDPLEQTNLAATHPALCKELRQRIAAWAHTQRRMWQ